MGSYRKLVIPGAVLAAVMITGTAFSLAAPAGSEPTGRGRFGAGHMIHRRSGAEAPWVSMALKHRAELKLSSDQIAELEKIRSLYQNQTTPVRQQLRGVEQEISNLLQESPANLVQVKTKIEQAEKFRSELRYLRIEALENGKSVLTAQQRDQLKDMVASLRRRPHRSQGQAS